MDVCLEAVFEDLAAEAGGAPGLRGGQPARPLRHQHLLHPHRRDRRGGRPARGGGGDALLLPGAEDAAPRGHRLGADLAGGDRHRGGARQAAGQDGHPGGRSARASGSTGSSGRTSTRRPGCWPRGRRWRPSTAAMVGWGFPVGPVALLDEVGIDVGAKVAAILHAGFGERMKPPEALAGAGQGRAARPQGREGLLRLRREGGSGWTRRSTTSCPAAAPAGSPPDGAIAERLSLALMNEAARALAEGVVRGPRDGDVGAVFGIGFPPFRGGPFRALDAMGAAAAVEALRRLRDAHGERFEPAAALVEAAADRPALPRRVQGARRAPSHPGRAAPLASMMTRRAPRPATPHRLRLRPRGVPADHRDPDPGPVGARPATSSSACSSSPWWPPPWPAPPPPSWWCSARPGWPGSRPTSSTR